MKPVSRLLEPLRQRIMLMLARAVLKIVADDNGLQRVQVGVLAKETRDNVERFQQYGFTSHPLPGAEAVLCFMAGNRDHPVVLAIDDRRKRFRPIEAGEVAIYTHENVGGDHRFHLKRNRDAELALGRDLLRKIGRDETTEIGRDWKVNVGRNVIIEADTMIELKCGASRIVLEPDQIRVYTPDFEAVQS